MIKMNNKKTPFFKIKKYKDLFLKIFSKNTKLS